MNFTLSPRLLALPFLGLVSLSLMILLPTLTIAGEGIIRNSNKTALTQTSTGYAYRNESIHMELIEDLNGDFHIVLHNNSATAIHVSLHNNGSGRLHSSIHANGSGLTHVETHDNSIGSVHVTTMKK